MNDRELMERYKMALESIRVLTPSSDQGWKIATQALLQLPSDSKKEKEVWNENGY